MKKTTENATKEIKNHDVVVERAKLCKNGNVAMTLVINDVKIYNCFLVDCDKDGKHYTFVSFPNEKDASGKYWNIAYCALSDEDVATIKSMCQRLIDCE